MVCAGLCEEQGVRLQLVDVPLPTVLARYSALTGKRVEVVYGVRAVLTVQTPAEVPRDEAIKKIEGELGKQNIGFFPIGTNRLVATWIDAAKAPPAMPSYRDRLDFRRRATNQTDSARTGIATNRANAARETPARQP